jgi:hypothetical protein
LESMTDEERNNLVQEMGVAENFQSI